MVPVRVPCVGAIVFDAAGRLLLVQRGREPARGCWSVPGGRVEAGESDAAAAAREVAEETGLRVVVGKLAGTVEHPAPDGSVYLIRDFLCRPARDVDTSVVRPGDDAADARWFRLDELAGLTCSPGLLEAFADWGVFAGGAGAPLGQPPRCLDRADTEPLEPPC